VHGPAARLHIVSRAVFAHFGARGSGARRPGALAPLGRAALTRGRGRGGIFVIPRIFKIYIFFENLKNHFFKYLTPIYLILKLMKYFISKIKLQQGEHFIKTMKLWNV
jgi:hypothetical protein